MVFVYISFVADCIFYGIQSAFAPNCPSGCNAILLGPFKDDPESKSLFLTLVYKNPDNSTQSDGSINLKNISSMLLSTIPEVTNK